ncbi:hypothetical protein ACIBEA_06635 [Streptomyces sp. NPDC051555]|uniref:hypothetical protein n=1 Tax=Streptomyces sp. NPDC051555 TaxID=3365657 RepID=UPI00379565BF
MIVRLFPAVSALVLAGALALGAAPAQAGGSAVHAPAVTQPGAQAADSVLLAPWQSAHVRLSAQTQSWLSSNGVIFTAIAPFVLDSDGLGFTVPSGETSGDEAALPGGFGLSKGGTSLDFASSAFKVLLRANWNADNVNVNGSSVGTNVLIARSTAAELLAHRTLGPNGLRVTGALPLHVSDSLESLTQEQLDTSPVAGDVFFTLTPTYAN